MCGIGALIRLNDNIEDKEMLRMVNRMLLGLEHRGPHASGVTAIHKTNVVTFKQPEPAHEFVRNEKFIKFMAKNIKASAFLVHARFATQGDPSINKNNHPLETRDYVIIHNGTILDSTQKFVDRHLKNVGNKLWDQGIETDSMALIKLAQIGGPDAASNAETNSGAFILYNKQTHELSIFRNANTLCVGYARHAGILAFASTQDIMEQVIGRNQYLFGFFKQELEDIWVEDIAHDKLYSCMLFEKEVFFNRVFGSHEKNKSLEKKIDRFYNSHVHKLGDKYLIEFTDDVAKKVQEQLKASGFLQTKEDKKFWEVAVKDAPKLLTLLEKHKEPKWSGGTRIRGGYNSGSRGSGCSRHSSDLGSNEQWYAEWNTHDNENYGIK